MKKPQGFGGEGRFGEAGRQMEVGLGGFGRVAEVRS